MASIEAKPTEYKGTIYRSRLEARWAVYLDVHPGILKPKYEYKSLQTGIGWYTPDFFFFLKKAQGFHLEVKPAEPSAEYLRRLLSLITNEPISLLLAVGDFYEGEPTVYEINSAFREKQLGGDGTKILGARLSKIPLLGNDYALRSAAGYRFDLANPEKKGFKNGPNTQIPSPRKKKRRP